MLEPLSLFNISPKLFLQLGWIGYLSLFSFSFISSIVATRAWIKLKSHRVNYSQAAVESSTEDSTYLVKFPSNMQVWLFMERFIEHLSQGTEKDRVKAISTFYSPVLKIKRNNKLIELDHNMSFSDISLEDGDTLQISGNPKYIDLSPNYAKKR